MKASTIACLMVVAATATTTVFTQEQKLSAALTSLVQAERDFAKYSVAQGTREAFLNFFSDEGINFRPHPTKTREALLKRPAPSAPSAFVLDWAPLVAEVSQAGDLGYTTGPYVLENSGNKEKQHGLYSSVWKKQSDGSWKVVLDIGVRTPAAIASLDATLITPQDAAAAGRQPRTEESLRTLNEAVQGLARITAVQGLEAAYDRYAAQRIRVHRQEAPPILGLRALRQWLASQPRKMKLEALKTEASGDLGYSYGSYNLTTGEGSNEKGYYTHFWRWLGNDGWHIVFEVSNPLPTAKN